ncbi:hypothetical protein HPB47_018007 [Ixodes persulcatus]|uniref:Uncharacterized protein n=1 Tax=Ixodes persulcatus TaxID=34615 RepID=A0AC60QMN1_IXOPE|nr:hypothetical protein HPB47_018007 [Ixodes persulcatus]
MFSLRIVTVDHYLAAPVPRLDPGFSRLGGWEVWKVPVIRIFGVTSGGQKACLHVHGVFPYLCVPFDEDSGERADKFAPMLASELDLLLNTAAGRATSRQHHVHHVEAFRGTMGRLHALSGKEDWLRKERRRTQQREWVRNRRKAAVASTSTASSASDSLAKEEHIARLKSLPPRTEPAMPLYGFHNKERTFLKIYLYNPYSVKK